MFFSVVGDTRDVVAEVIGVVALVVMCEKLVLEALPDGWPGAEILREHRLHLPLYPTFTHVSSPETNAGARPQHSYTYNNSVT